MRMNILAIPISHALTSLASLPTQGQSNLAGTWEGQAQHASATGPFGQTFTIRLRIGENGTATVDYPTLYCKGTLIWQRTVGQASEYREQIDVGKNNCAPNGTVLIQGKSGGLDWHWTGGPLKQVSATAQLLRAQAQQPSPPSAQTGVDPFAYCQAKGNTPTSEETPTVVAYAVGAGAWWRCKGGEVYGCYPGASGRACQRWNASKKPTQSIREACRPIWYGC